MQNVPNRWRLPRWLKVVLWVTALPVVLGVLIGAFAPTPEEAAAREKEKAEKLASEVEVLAAAQTLYLEPRDAKLMPILKQGAMNLLKSGKCPAIMGGSRSSNNPGKTDPNFFYVCDDGSVAGVKFYLSANKIRDGKLGLSN